MRDTSAGRHDPARYEIRIQGHLDVRWATQLAGMTLTAEHDGTTVIEGLVVDQAALHGLLAKLRDIGVPLISVTQMDSVLLAPATNPPFTNRPDTTPQGD